MPSELWANMSGGQRAAAVTSHPCKITFFAGSYVSVCQPAQQPSVSAADRRSQTRRLASSIARLRQQTEHSKRRWTTEQPDTRKIPLEVGRKEGLGKL